MADLGCEAQGIWGLEELGRFLLGDGYSGYWGIQGFWVSEALEGFSYLQNTGI